MAWSTPQLAELAGTTVKAVRYYHDIGLLDLPERAANGYKQYGVAHLLRLLRIRRLSDLGVPLSEIAAMGRADEQPEEAIRVLDAELEATVDRLNRVRAELALILRHRAPAHVPPAFAPVSRGLSERQRSLLMVYSTVLSERSVEDIRALLGEAGPVDEEFEALPPDADDAAVERQAARLLPVVRAVYEGNPGMLDPVTDSPRGARTAETALSEAIVQLHNPAQLRVVERVIALLTEEGTGPDDDAR
ncbi:hypothetical protein SUDANB121_05342 [Nocardiopsis dassonvillei]|uniref:MerR family transcriptional regulator n=1 Tax=Nocardiopsis dassonvillei TaxID=2014 RepID=UPI003F554F58